MHKFLILLEIIVDAKPHFFLLIKIKQAIHVNINYREIFSVLTRPRPCGIAGFQQEKLKWRIKTKKMCPLGCRGKLRVKRT